MTEGNRIAVICNYRLLAERVGGMDYFFWAFDKACKTKDIEVDWFFPNRSGHGDYPSLTIYADEDRSVENLFLSNLEVNKYSHIITHFTELCTPFYKKVRTKSQATVIAVDHNPRPLGGYPLKKRWSKKLKGFLYANYIDLFVGVSQYTVNEIMNDFGSHLRSKTRTIYNGVILEEISMRQQRNVTKPTFLVASHLRESKGIQDLIDAVNLLPIQIKQEIRIDLYGDGPYKKQLDIKINMYNLQSCFSFKGSTSKLKEIYANYDYLLQPTHMECFSLSILESLAANVPVITTRVGGNAEVIVSGENGFLFEAKDILALKEIIEDVFLRGENLPANTRTVIESGFSLRKMVDNHLGLILNN